MFVPNILFGWVGEAAKKKFTDLELKRLTATQVIFVDERKDALIVAHGHALQALLTPHERKTMQEIKAVISGEERTCFRFISETTKKARIVVAWDRLFYGSPDFGEICLGVPLIAYTDSNPRLLDAHASDFSIPHAFDVGKITKCHGRVTNHFTDFGSSKLIITG